jgi:hypothetical protein
MLIYTIGCSITHGYGVGFENSWPSLIQKYLDFDVINDSKCGVGNDWILHTSLEKLLKLKKKPDLVILQWSGPNRRVHMDLEGNEWLVNLHDHLHLQPKFEPMASIHTIHYMFFLQSFLEKNNIPYLFFNYMELDESVKKIEVYNHIDWKKKLDINKNMMLAKGYVYDEIGHPNLNGQYFIARSILKTLNIDEKTIPDFIKTIL